MEVSPRSRIGGGWTEQLLSSRRGAVAISAAAALLAGVLFYLFVQHYRKAPVAVGPTQEYVFVANHYIAPGTPESTVIAQGLLSRSEVPSNQVLAGTIADPSAITGEIATTGIAAGQQITTADFVRSPSTLGAYLSGDERAVAIPLDPSHGLTAYLQRGDVVDVLVDSGQPNGLTKMLYQNISVLANSAGDIVLKVTDRQALAVVAAADNEKLWLTLRPAMGATDTVQAGQGVYN